MKAALHRSITFWSGLLVVGFVCWAWWDSWQRPLEIGIGKWRFSQAFSGVGIQRFHYHQPTASWMHCQLLSNKAFPAVFYASAQGKNHGGNAVEFRQRTDPKGRSLSEVLPVRFEYFPRGARLLFIPHWLILLAVAGVWLGLLFWRARRRRLTVIAHDAEGAVASPGSLSG